MAQIGNFEVTVFKGRLLPARRLVAVIDPGVGVDGNAVARGAWRSSPAAVETLTEVDGTIGDALNLIDNCRAMAGTLVSVTDQFDVPWDNVAVLDVSAVASATNDPAVFLIRAAWLLLPDTDSPEISTNP